MKLVVDADSDTVVGIHMIGPDCAEIMQVRLSDDAAYPKILHSVVNM